MFKGIKTMQNLYSKFYNKYIPQVWTKQKSASIHIWVDILHTHGIPQQDPFTAFILFCM